MEQSPKKDGEKTATQARIDALIETNKHLLKRRDNLRTESQKLMRKSSFITELELRLNKELNQLCVIEKTFVNEVQTVRDLVEEKRGLVDKAKAIKDTKEESRLDELKLFEGKIAEAVPKFENAPIVYSNSNLAKLIEEIKNKNFQIEGEIDCIDRETKAILSRHNFQDEDNTMINEYPGDGTEIANLKQLKAICCDSNSAEISSRKQVEKVNEELRKMIEQNNRKLNNLKNY